MIKHILTVVMLAVCISTMAQRTMTGGDGVGKMPYFTCPSMGEMHFPVIIVQYQDIKLSDTQENVIQHFDDFFNRPGYNHNGATGSVRDYFLSASAGRFSPHFDILGVVQLANKRSYYGKGAGTAAGHPDEMVIEAVTQLQEQVDCTKYDSNADGYVDDVIVVYAGNAERFGASTSAVLPTSFLISFNKWGEEEYTYGLQLEHLYVNSYTVTSELAWSQYDGIGTFLHEFSHGLGLADLYNVYDSAADYTPQQYDLMDIGLYNNSSNTPPTYSAFERYALGWIDLEVIDGPCTLTLDYLGTSNKGYIIPVTDNEFFIIENRQQEGWDTYLPGHGLLVWHIDYDYTAWYDNAANREKEHQRIALVTPIDGSYIINTTWSGTNMGLHITDIIESNGRITATIESTTGISLPQCQHTAPTHLYDLAGRTLAHDTTVKWRAHKKINRPHTTTTDILVIALQQ